MKTSLLLAPLAAAIAATPAVAQADAVAGSRQFLQCRACHTVGAGEKSGVGPNLNGVVGAKAGTKGGYTYSPAMTKSGLVWDAKTLDTFLTRPMATVPGTKMAFAGVINPKTRADLIAYLATLKAGAKPGAK